MAPSLARRTGIPPGTVAALRGAMLAHASGQPYVDLLKHFAANNWDGVGFEGDVQQTIDIGLGKRVFVLRGATAAANCMSIPRIGWPPLGLSEQYLYLQVKLAGRGKPFALHVDILTTDRCVRAGRRRWRWRQEVRRATKARAVR